MEQTQQEIYSAGYNAAKSGKTTRSNSTKALDAILLSIQKEIGGAARSSDNPFFKSKYADLDEVKTTITTAMEKADAWVLIKQYPAVHYDQSINKPINKDLMGVFPLISVTTRITDPGSGEWEETTLECLPKEDSPQAIGSAITYLRRYSLMPLFHVAPADDDGNAASGNAGAPARQPAPRPIPPIPPRSTPAPTAPQESQAPIHTADTTTPVPTTGSLNRALSDTERARAGLIGQAAFEAMKAKLKEKKIAPAKWKTWLQANYNRGALSEITVDEFPKIMLIIETKPETINNPEGGNA